MKRALLLLGLPGAAFVLGVYAAESTDYPPRHSRYSEFNFVRVEYDSVGGYSEAYYYYDGRMWQRWETDHPQADENFVHRLRELTTTLPNPRSVTRRLTDDDVFEFPFLYMCDVGWMDLNAREKERLRQYLLKGGFVWVDDFWGWAEWRNFELIMEEIFPDRGWQAIPSDHPILTSVFQLEACPQVPARDFAISGMKHDPPGIHRYPAIGIEEVNFRGYFDDDGRLMVLTTHNTDIGDGWEREAYGEWYFETYSTVSYAMGVNVIAYVTSH